MNFFLSKDGQKLGPYSVEQIQIFLKQGLVTTSDQVWAEGWSSWIPIGNVPGMAGGSTAASHGVSSPPIFASSIEGTNPKGLNLLCVWMHLSQFTAFITLLAGYVLPIMIWQMNKDSHPMIDKQGRIIANWIISSLIYDFLVIFLCFFWIGFLILPFLCLVEIAFPIIGALKASRGEVWNYPMNIAFFKVQELINLAGIGPMDIYLLTNDVKTGPYSEAQVRGMLDSGATSSNDMAWREGLKDWVPLGLIVFGAAPPAPQHSPASTATGMSRKGFQALVVLSLVLFIAYMLVSICEANSSQAQTSNNSVSDTVLGCAFLFIILSPPYVGLLLIKNWGRILFTVVQALILIVTSLGGAMAASATSNVLGTLWDMANGAIIAISFFTPLFGVLEKSK